MNRSELLDGGAFCRTAFAAINKTATAGSTGDATEVDGAWVGRKGAAGDKPQAMSAKLVIAFTTALAAGKTLTFAVQFRDATSSGGAGADDYGDAVAATIVATGGSGGSTETGTFEVDVDLAGAREFVQAQVTPNLDATDTDTAEWSAVLVLFGANRTPMSAAEKVGGIA